MKPGSTTTSLKPRKRTRNGAISPHQTRKNSAENRLLERLCWYLLRWTRGNFGALQTQGKTVTSATYAYLLKHHMRCAFKSKRRGRLSTGVLFQHDNARPHVARSTVATIDDVLRVSSTSAVRAKPRPPSDFRVFGPLKAVGIFHVRRSGCAVSHKIFFVELSMHIRSAGNFVWNAVETT